MKDWNGAGIIALELVNLDPDDRGRIVSVNATARVTAGGEYIQTVELHGALPGRFLSMAKGLDSLQEFGITDALTNPFFLYSSDQLGSPGSYWQKMMIGKIITALVRWRSPGKAPLWFAGSCFSC